jgi:hypothetical protein
MSDYIFRKHFPPTTVLRMPRALLTFNEYYTNPHKIGIMAKDWTETMRSVTGSLAKDRLDPYRFGSRNAIMAL